MQYLAIAFILFAQATQAEPSWYTEPNTRQAITFSVADVSGEYLLVPKRDANTSGFRINFDSELEPEGYFKAPQTLSIKAVAENQSDMLSFLLPKFGYHYAGERQADEASFRIQARQQARDGNAPTIKILIYTGERDAVATLLFNFSKQEAVLVENRAYSMAPFLLELIADDKQPNERVASCLRRYSNDDYVCVKPE